MYLNSYNGSHLIAGRKRHSLIVFIHGNCLKCVTLLLILGKYFDGGDSLQVNYYALKIALFSFAQSSKVVAGLPV
jgi:hypothetical protein